MRRPQHLARWIGGAVVLAVVVGVGAPYAYIHWIEGPPPKELTAAEASVAPVSGPTDGTWTVGTGSQAGYRVGEVLAGQSTTAVGRTDAITGTMTVSGTSVTAASFTVDLTKVTSDQSRRDDQFQGRIMDTASHPTATFALGSPVTLPAGALTGSSVKVTVTGSLQLHGTTRTVSFPMTVQRSGTTVRASGQIPVTFADYGIDNPSVGGFVTTQDHGVVEVLVVMTRG